jgi:hypothetical protein
MIRSESDKLTREALRLEGRPFHRGGLTFQRCLLPFDSASGGVYQAQAQRPFVPRGLAVWGAPPGAMLAFATCGQQLQLVASLGSVPARFFASGDSYEQIAKQLDAGAEPPAWCDWDPVEPGVYIRLTFTELDGKPLQTAVELAMWGVAAL